MKLMKRLIRKNNKGMSLVELICAVAILGLTTTALGGAMVMSAQHYHRDSAEFEVQQEAQTATNLIGNLVVDAAKAEWSSNKLIITSDGKQHEIYQVDDKLVYKNTSDGTEGVLAEGVVPGGFTADTTNFESNKSVNVSLKLENDGKEFSSNYNATSRNGELSTAEFAEKVCVISMEDEVVIEPKQEVKMPVDVLGMDMSQVGGLTLDKNGVPSEWASSDAIKYDATTKEIILKAPENAVQGFTFEVETNGTKPNSSDKWATKTVTVKVRRVDGIVINHASGNAYTAGSEYVFSAAVLGQNMNKGYGKGYDLDYKNPKFVHFEISGVDYSVVEDKSKTDTPYIKIKLDENMAPNQTFTVKAYSAHAKGTIGGIKYNKTGAFYKEVVDVTSVTAPDNPAPVPTIDPSYPIPDLPSGMLRGEDYSWGLSVPSCDTLKDKLKDKYDDDNPGITMHYEWFVSFKESGAPETDWTPWHMTCQAGNNQKIDGTFETTIMLPDKAYDLRFFILYYDKNTKKVLYPHDEGLLATGNGLAEAGFTKGWDDGDAAATQFAQYGRSTFLPATSLYYYNEGDTNTHYDSMGSVSNPIKYKFGDGSTPKVYFNMRHLSVARTMYTYTPVVWKLQDDNSWKKLYASDLAKIFKAEINGGSPRYIEFKEMQNYANTDDLKTAACGTYRIGIDLAGTAQKYTSIKADSVRESNGFADVTLSPMKLYDENGTNGFIYFKIEK